MSSRDSLEIRRLLAKGVVGQVADDQSVAIRLKPALNTVVTSVTVNTATDITIITGAGTTVYDFATSVTLGELVDRINADGEFSIKLLDALRTIPSANNLIAGVLALTSDGYYDVMLDTSNANMLVYRMSYDRDVGAQRPTASHRVELKEIVYNVTLGGSGTVMVIEAVRGSVEKLLFQATAVSATPTTINWAGGTGKISADEGNDLIILVLDTVSITGALTVSGYNI
jgi:hypothetical protein